MNQQLTNDKPMERELTLEQLKEGYMDVQYHENFVVGVRKQFKVLWKTVDGTFIVEEPGRRVLRSPCQF